MTIELIPLDQIVPNKYQTRTHADPDHIRDIADSIKRGRLLQTPAGRHLSDGTVQLAFGHNRLAAYRLLYSESAVANELAGRDFSAMPIDVQDNLTDEAMADFAWDENIHAPLTPLDRARSIKQRIDSFGWTHNQAGQHLGLKRATVSNVLRLLDLPEEIQAKLDAGDITERKATALLAFFDLPESLRLKMETNYSYSGKASELIKDAGAMSSDAIRERITRLISNAASNLTANAVFDLNAVKIFAASDPNVYPHVQRLACRTCPFRLERDKNQYCANPDCFEEKQVIWKSDRLAAASKAAGVPVLDDWRKFKSYGGTETTFGDYRSTKLVPQIRQAGCDNLRLVWLETYHHGDADSLKAEGFSEVGLVCQKRSGFCTCIKGLEVLNKSLDIQAHSQPAQVGAPTIAPDPEGEQDEFDIEHSPDIFFSHEVPGENEALDELYREDEGQIAQPAITQESLKAEADAARRAERLARKQLDAIMQNASKVLSSCLQVSHPGALAWLHKQIVGSYTTVDPAWTAADLFDGIAYIMIKRSYYSGRPALEYIDELRHIFERASISMDGVFEIKEGG